MPRKFNRCFDKELFLGLKMFLNTPVGQKILSPSQNIKYQICFRENYINIYYKGCSILKYSPNARVRKHTIHYKYTTQENGNHNVGEKANRYITLQLINNNTDLVPVKEDTNNSGWKFSNLLESPEKFLGETTKGEKSLIAKYLENSYIEEQFLLLDLEVAFTRKVDEAEIKKRDYVADRIDMACICINEDSKPVLRLFEVKEANDPRLKNDHNDQTENKKQTEPPEIITQMKHYCNFLNNEASEGIMKSYKKIAKHFYDLLDEGLLPKSYFPEKIQGKKTKDILEEFTKNPVIDEKPYLLIIESKKNCGCETKILERGRNNQNHWKRLQELFKNANYPEPLYVTI